MIRNHFFIRALAAWACLSLAVTGASAADVFVDAARPDDSGDGLSWATAKATIGAAIPLVQDNSSLFIKTGEYSEATPTFNGATNFINKINVTISGTPDDPATPLVDERPLLHNGILFLNDTNSGLTIENLSIDGKAAGQIYLMFLGRTGTGRTDVTIRNCKFDGRHQGVNPNYTHGVYCGRLLGTFRFENNEITGLTGSVAFSPTGAGNAEPAYVLQYAHVVNNYIHDTTGSIDVRGDAAGDSFDPGSPNPVIYFIGNRYERMDPSAVASGGAFKLFHCKEAYFLNNYLVATNVTYSVFPVDPLLAPPPTTVVKGVGLLYLNVQKMVVAGNTFQNCLQAVAHDPNPSQITYKNNCSPPSDFQVYNNTFINNTVAVYFCSLTIPGKKANAIPVTAWIPSGTTTGTLQFYGNNFANNDKALFCQAYSDDIDIDLSDNWWGDPAGPQPGDIDMVYPGPAVDTSSPAPVIFLGDSDGDGLTDSDEELGNNEPNHYVTNPTLKDTDGDGYEDGVELALGSDPTNNASVPAGAPGPGVDSDGDGYTDNYELAVGTDPNDPNSAPLLGDATGDGVVDNVDAIVIVAVVVGVAGFDSSRFNFKQMDINRNGSIDNVDAIQLLNFFLDNITALPVQ